MPRLFALVCTLILAAAAPAQMTLTVDATDVSRRLLHATLEMPAAPGPMDVFYVEWTPGNHNPSGPIQNLVNFEVRDADGQELRWKRDPTKVVKISFDVPEGSETVTLSYTYIASQPSVISKSTDSYGLRSLGGISWNTLLFEPENADKDALTVDASVQLPSGWLLSSSLAVRASRGGYYDFEPVSFAYLVDAPAIFGEFVSTWEIAHESIPHLVEAVADDPRHLEMSQEMLDALAEMVRQTELVFGPFPYRRYHFLTFLCDEVPGFGLEHCESTYISWDDRRFTNDDTSAMGTFPHEYIHAWCGKLRAPEGLLARDFHTDGFTELLWVYEGLTSYYDDVIMARSGMMTPEQYVDTIASRVERYQQQTGRLWRSVEDTASGQRHLRTTSPAWEEVRRRQDYYSEGAFFWMAADAAIREGTGQTKSLDDFCRAFFDVEPINFGTPVTYTRQDIVEALEAVYDGRDWDAMIRDWIETPRETLEHPLPAAVGRELAYHAEPTDIQNDHDDPPFSGLTARTLGFSTDRDGRVQKVLAGTPADDAKISYGMTVLGVDGRVFSPAVLKEAIKNAGRTGRVDLVVRFDDRIEVRSVACEGGLKYPRLDLTPGAFDAIGAIITPR